MAASALGFSLMTLLAKLIGPRIPPTQVILVRTLVTLVGTFVLLQRAGVRPRLGRHRRLLVLRGVAGFVALDCLFYAVPRLPLAEATMLQYLNPVLVTILAAAFLGERITRRAALALGLCVLGVVLVTRPAALVGSGSTALDRTAVAVALLGALLSSVAYLTIRVIGPREHPYVVVLYLPLISLPLAAVQTLRAYVPPTPREWALLLGIGVLTQGAQVALTRALQLEAAGRATTVGYVQIVFAALWGVLFLDEVPSGTTLVGGALLLTGVVLASRASRTPRLAEEASSPPGSA